MGYILKNTAGLINTRITDTGRQKISQGNFNISYFQIGDSEVSYSAIPQTIYNQYNSRVLEPSFNAQNSAGAPHSNKENIKYPYYVDGNNGNTYGIPFMQSIVSPVYNTASPRGFFLGTTLGSNIEWSAITTGDYALTSNYVIQMSGLNGSNLIVVSAITCNNDFVRNYQIGDFITIIYDGNGIDNCNCFTATTTTTTLPVTTTTTTDACSPPSPPTTTTTTTCPITNCGPCLPSYSASCVVDMSSCYTILTYRIVDVCLDNITLDRSTPDFTYLSGDCYARVIVYPSGMTEIYDSVTPSQHFPYDVINFESVCYTDQFDVKIWNMNIPWSESPAGINSSTHKDYTQFGSIDYLGSKEYFGYASSSGQTDTDSTYYYNSFDEKVVVTPEEQKAIAIIHYTNNTIDFFYGEKFALEPHDITEPDDTTGEARNFKLHIPWLMWHKNPQCCYGQTFYVDPPGFDDLITPLFTVHYLESNQNQDMNNPGIRYYHLWDTNPNPNTTPIAGIPNRIGKVFPDHKLIIIDDEEIVAAMSYKANRNWTLPAPKVALITPNICGLDNESVEGILTGETEYLHVTYRLSNLSAYTNSLHSNYYQVIQGPNITCNPLTSQNVSVRFGDEFNCLSSIPSLCSVGCDITSGFIADSFEIICQKVEGNGRPEPSQWRIIDYTFQLSGTSNNGYLTQSGLTGNTFVITQDLYDNAPLYDLSDYIDITTAGFSGTQLNFGDEYYFYGNIETDIQATIYEMRYQVVLGQSEFQYSSNPSWNTSVQPFITEIGLYDSDKNLMIVSKLQSPYPRTGIQQFVIKLDI